MSIIELAKELGKSQARALEAYRAAKKYYQEYLDFLRTGADVNHALRLVHRGRPFELPKRKSKGDIRLLVLGHGYNLFDTYVNLDFQKKLRDQDVDILTIENLPESLFKVPVIPSIGILHNSAIERFSVITLIVLFKQDE